MIESYRSYLLARYQGEVFGEALFAGLAQRSADEEAKRKWRHLEKLEQRTKERIRPALERLGLSCDEDPARRRQGEKLAERLCSVPWGELMKGMRLEFGKFVREFCEAETLAPPGEEELARYITDHERALLQFAALELEKPGEDSLEPVRRLLA